MCVALVIGNSIGSGIFLLPAALAPFGLNSLWAWGFTASGAILLAIVFSRLSRALPQAGGPYAYVQEAFGPLPAFFWTPSFIRPRHCCWARLKARAVRASFEPAPGPLGPPPMLTLIP